MRKEYLISINGCDDSTKIRMKLNSTEFAIIYELAQKSIKTSTYICMPVITIKKLSQKDKEKTL